MQHDNQTNMADTFCRVCNSNDVNLLLSLGRQPPANDLAMDRISAIAAERYDLSLLMCNQCLYVWLKEGVPKEKLFRYNTYLTGISLETRNDMRNFAESCIASCDLDSSSKVLDIASNDGTLLEIFRKKTDHVFGIDPSSNACAIASSKGIKTINDFFGGDTVDKILREFGKTDLITATNIITHVDDPKEFFNNCKLILKTNGSIVVEFYNFESLISNTAFDQIYHEHISYFNFTTFFFLLNSIGLESYKVEQVKSQGGSLRVFISFKGNKKIDKSVNETLLAEGGMKAIKDKYVTFSQLVSRRRKDILDFLNSALNSGSKIVGYGASAKATVLLNYLGISRNEILAVGDKNPIKQWKYIPGVAIPVVPVENLKEFNPDIVIIFAWNLSNEITKELHKIFTRRITVVTFMPKISSVRLGD